MKTFVRQLTPKNPAFKPHTWKEGGQFLTAADAEFQAKQIRKTRDYSRVQVLFGRGIKLLEAA